MGAASKYKPLSYDDANRLLHLFHEMKEKAFSHARYLATDLFEKVEAREEAYSDEPQDVVKEHVVADNKERYKDMMAELNNALPWLNIHRKLF
jgi:hypothetical protein